MIINIKLKEGHHITVLVLTQVIAVHVQDQDHIVWRVVEIRTTDVEEDEVERQANIKNRKCYKLTYISGINVFKTILKYLEQENHLHHRLVHENPQLV